MRQSFSAPPLATLAALAALAFTFAAPAQPAATAPAPSTPHVPTTLLADPRVRLDFTPERIILPRGLQPSLICTAAGALVVQGQIPEKPPASPRYHYPSALGTVISRDAGVTWNPFDVAGLNLEGGSIQLRDKTVLSLDTYIVPAKRPDEGLGQLYTSTDDLASLSPPRDVDVLLPDADFNASADDGGRPYSVERVHRRLVEMPDGSLLAEVYGCTHKDHEPSSYEPRMMKTRIIIIRSTDRGLHWQQISQIALKPAPDTEGLGEPTLCRVSAAPHEGRLICLMRTGRNLYQAVSDDDAKTWTPAKPLIFADRDVDRSELWVDQFRKFKGPHGLLDEKNQLDLRGAVVDPDLIELRSGILVACFGVRVPQKLCWAHPEHPWNGNYLALSLDHGESWSDVVQITSGVQTTHYMAIAEMPKDNDVYVAYDLGHWGKNAPREIVGRKLTISRNNGK